MSALTWATLQSQLVAMLAQGAPPGYTPPADFALEYPRATSYAESRICAEIPLLANQTQDSSLTVTPGTRQLNLSGMTNPLVVLERLTLITPSGATPAAGTRWLYVKTTLDFIDAIWPNESTLIGPDTFNAEQIGRYWAPLNTGSTTAAYAGSTSIIIIAPTPPFAYAAELTGLFQPIPLGPSNTTTYLSTVYPDLLTAACMVYLEGALKRNFGAASDDPRQAVSWEGVYQQLKDACEFEEMRRRGLAPNQPRGPAPPAASDR